MSATLLLLADGRLPSGGHAHSGGFEPVAGLGLVRTLDDLGAFLRGRLHTAGLTAAALAAAVFTTALDDLDRAADARMPSPAAREASRRQGRQLLRAARSVWPSRLYDDLSLRPHQPIVVGVAARAGGLTPDAAALAAAHGSVTGAASAAVRLQSLDPIAVHALLAELSPEVDAVAATATEAARHGDIPAPAAPLLELAAEDHATWEVRLFAS